MSDNLIVQGFNILFTYTMCEFSQDLNDVPSTSPYLFLKINLLLNIFFVKIWFDPRAKNEAFLEVEPEVQYRISHSNLYCYGSAAVLYIFSLHTSDWLQIPMYLTVCLLPGCTADIWVRRRLPWSEPAVQLLSNNLFVFAYSITLETSAEHTVCNLSFSILL